MSLDLSMLKNLKAAGEEVKKASSLGAALGEAVANDGRATLPHVVFSLGQDAEASSLFQKMGELAEEQAALEKAREKVMRIEKKLEERIEFLKSLRTRGVEISRSLKEFEQQLVFARKDSGNFWGELKI